jgi:UDP-N-acetylglucosamine--N-acetylmuramyl-(pentapeptide) pyrophosphoryl-undecaprenol N-acetylglucosamine transferase
LQAQGLDAKQFLWIGTRGQMEEDLVPRAGLTLETIEGGPIVGVPPQESFMNAAQLTWSLGKTNRLFGRFRPDVLFMTGGYVNVPVALVSWLRRVPAAIFLPDVEPGTAIKFLTRFAKRVAATTAASRQYLPSEKVVITGYPVREELREAAAMDLEEALVQFDLRPERATLLVFGGSRGARSINRALIPILPELLAELQVIHISGTLDWHEVEAAALDLTADQRRYYRPFAYLHGRMGAAFRAADLAVARAGASMLGEVPAFALPAILVPYPHAWRYQKVNADYLVQRGAAVQIDDATLPERLLPTIFELVHDEARRTRMAVAALALDVPNSADLLAQLLLSLGTEKGSATYD